MMYIASRGYKRKCTGRSQCSKFGTSCREFASATEKNIVPKFTNRVGHWSVGHCIRYANINVFSEPDFLIYRQKPRKNTHQRKLVYLRILPRVLLLAQKQTHY